MLGFSKAVAGRAGVALSLERMDLVIDKEPIYFMDDGHPPS